MLNNKSRATADSPRPKHQARVHRKAKCINRQSASVLCWRLSFVWAKMKLAKRLRDKTFSVIGERMVRASPFGSTTSTARRETSMLDTVATYHPPDIQSQPLHRRNGCNGSYDTQGCVRPANGSPTRARWCSPSGNVTSLRVRLISCIKLECYASAGFRTTYGRPFLSLIRTMMPFPRLSSFISILDGVFSGLLRK